MQALPDATLLPAHGRWRRRRTRRVDELLAHHEQRLDETADAVDAGASTGFEVATALRWTRHHRQLADLDMFNQIMAVHETMAHLRGARGTRLARSRGRRRRRACISRVPIDG